MIRILFLWLAAAGCSLAAESVAGAAAAMAYVEGLKNSEQNLEELVETTAVSPHLGDLRKEALLKLLRSIRTELRRGDFRFEVVDGKTEGRFGAVLIKGWSATNPIRLNVLVLGLVVRNGEWKVAPMPGTFDSVFLGFDREAERRAAEVAQWMTEQRALLLNELTEDAMKDLRQKLAEASHPVLREDDAGKVAEAFLEVCQTRDPMRVLAFLGGPGVEPTEAWFETMNIVSLGLAGQDAQQQWRRMVDPDVIRLAVNVAGGRKEGEFSILFFDPHEARVVENWKIEMKRKDGRWRLFLPPELLHADRTEEEFMKVAHSGRKWQDRRIREQFRVRFEERHEPVAAASAEEAARVLEDILRGGNFIDFARHLLPARYQSEVEAGVQLAEAAEIWSEVDQGAGPREVRHLETVAEENAALAVFSRIDPRKVGWVELLGIQLVPGDDGWSIAPGVRVAGDFKEITEAQRSDQEEVWRSYTERLRQLRAEAAAPLREALLVCDGPGKAAAQKDEAQALVRAYREELTAETNTNILARCAVLDADGGLRAGLRTLSYEFRGGRAAPGPAEILACRSLGGWCGVSVFVPAEAHTEPNFPLYLVVQTREGPRILVDVDLRLATNKGRELLNERALARVADLLGEDELALVRELFQGHIEVAQRRFEEWEKNSK